MSKSPFLEKIREAIRVRHYSIRTERTYIEPALFTTLPTAAPPDPRLRRFARSRILNVQASTPPVRSVAKRRIHWA